MPPSAQPARTSNTKTIAANSIWYGMETLTGFVLLFATSIPLANIIGPEKLGYFNYVGWLTAMSTSLGSLGIPSMAGKFMAEYLGRREEGVVHAIFFSSLRLQIFLAVLVTSLCIGVVLLWGDPRYQTVSILQVLSILPGMLIGIPSLANVAAERMRENFAGSMASAGIYLLGVLLSLWLHWGLVGVAASFLAGRVAELGLKLVPCVRWINGYARGSISKALRRQMSSFTRQQLILLVLGLVVWDRSDVVMLKFLSSDIKQVTFFTIAYNLSEKLLLAPRVFGAAVSASLMAQYGRGRERLNEMAGAAAKYMFLAGMPLLTGMALVSGPLIRLFYRPEYKPVIPVLAAGCLFAVVKSLIDPADSIVRANNRQSAGVYSSLACAVVNLGIDWVLIPAMGAMGAAIGNGVAQSLHVIVYWVICMKIFGLRLDLRAFGKIAVAAVAMAPPVLLCNRFMPPLPALVAGAITGAITYLAVLRLTSFFDVQDSARIAHLRNTLPMGLRPAATRVLTLMIPEMTAS